MTQSMSILEEMICTHTVCIVYCTHACTHIICTYVTCSIYIRAYCTYVHVSRLVILSLKIKGTDWSTFAMYWGTTLTLLVMYPSF